MSRKWTSSLTRLANSAMQQRQHGGADRWQHGGPCVDQAGKIGIEWFCANRRTNAFVRWAYVIARNDVRVRYCQLPKLDVVGSNPIARCERKPLAERSLAYLPVVGSAAKKTSCR